MSENSISTNVVSCVSADAIYPDVEFMTSEMTTQSPMLYTYTSEKRKQLSNNFLFLDTMEIYVNKYMDIPNVDVYDVEKKLLFNCFLFRYAMHIYTLGIRWSFSTFTLTALAKRKQLNN